MKHRLFVAVVVVAAVGGAACGGGGGGDGPEDPAPRIEGLLTGTATRSSTGREVIAHASEGRFMAAEATSSGFFFDGDYTLDNGTLSGSARIYGTNVGPAHARYLTETAAVSGTASEDAWQVTITGASSTTTFALTHHAEDTQDSSLAAVQGTWVYDAAGSNTSTLTIASDGTTSSTNDNGCASNGSIAIIDPAYTLYDSATTVSDATGGCPDTAEGGYTGLISLFDYLAGGDDELIVMLAQSDFMLVYGYIRQP